MASEVQVTLWRKHAEGGWFQTAVLDSWSELALEPRFNQPGTWSMKLAYGKQALKIRKADLVVFDFRGARMTGVIESIGPFADDKGQPFLEVSGMDALTLLGDVICFPDPAQPPNDQTKTHYRATGAAETVLRSLAKANTDRRGDDYFYPASEGRGGAIRVTERFSNLLERATKKCNKAGLGIRMGLQETTGTRARMVVEFFEPRYRQRVIFSPSIGTLKTWRQMDAVPAATRAFVLGDGKGVDRKIRLVTSAGPNSPDYEARWGRMRETTVDAKGTATDDAGTILPSEVNAALDEKGEEALAELVTQSSFEMEAAEAQGMRYGVHYFLGDSVNVQLLDGLNVVDVVRMVKVKASTGGVTIEPVPGNPDAANPLFGQAQIVRALNQQVKSVQREEA